MEFKCYGNSREKCFDPLFKPKNLNLIINFIKGVAMSNYAVT